MSEIEALLLEMLQIPSVSGEEKMMGEFLVSQLAGFAVEKQLVEKDRFNVIARKGNPKVYIVVHMDTVPGVVPIKVTKDKIFGRGAIDNKGNIAGAIIAARKLENIGLIFTVGEEDDFIGAKKVKIRNKKFVIMEPTKLQVMRGQRGLVAVTITTKGTQVHSSLNFKKEDSAVYNLTNILSQLYRKNWTAFNAIVTQGGEADNVVSGEASAKILMRPKNITEYKKIISDLGKISGKRIGKRIEDKIEPCVSSLVKNGGIVPFFSEMAFFKNSVLFGVGDIAVAHTVAEYVNRKELNQLANKLVQLVLDLEKK